MIRSLLMTAFFAISVTSLYAQEIEIKDDQVMLDGKAILKYEKINLIQVSFYDLESGDELLLYKSFDNETPKNFNDDYFVLNFLTEKKKVETTDFSKITSGMGFNTKKNMQKLVAWLIKK
jgi:hypothetical protein